MSPDIEPIVNDIMERLDLACEKISRDQYRKVLEEVTACIRCRLDCMDEEDAK